MQIKLVTNFTLLLILLYIQGLVANDSSTAIYSNTSLTGGAHIAMPGCRTKCGDLTIPYPYGISTNATCSINPFFDINCDKFFNLPKAFVCSTGCELLGISETKIRIKNRLAWVCYDHPGDISPPDFWMDLSGTLFSFSTKNKLTVIGCDAVGLMSRDRVGWAEFISSCVAICSKIEGMTDGFCSGIGCCQASIPKGLQSIYTTMTALNDHFYVKNSAPAATHFLQSRTAALSTYPTSQT